MDCIHSHAQQPYLLVLRGGLISFLALVWVDIVLESISVSLWLSHVFPAGWACERGRKLSSLILNVGPGYEPGCQFHAWSHDLVFVFLPDSAIKCCCIVVQQTNDIQCVRTHFFNQAWEIGLVDMSWCEIEVLNLQAWELADIIMTAEMLMGSLFIIYNFLGPWSTFELFAWLWLNWQIKFLRKWGARKWEKNGRGMGTFWFTVQCCIRMY